LQAQSADPRRPGTSAFPFALTLTLLVVGSQAATAAPRLRIAVGVERPQQLAFAEPPADHTAVRILAQGVREACADPRTHRLRSVPAACKTLGDVPESNICVDETTEHALTRQIECSPGDLTADAIDLSRSGCDTSGCYEVEARKAGATHLLVISGAWGDAGLTVAGRLIDLSDGSVHPVAPTNFAPRYSVDWPRTEPQVLALLKWLARVQTGTALLDAYDAEKAGGKSVAAVAVVAPAAPAPEIPRVPAAAPPDRSWLGWTLIGAGVVAGVGSAIVWSMNGDGRECDAGVAGDPNACRRFVRAAVPAAALGVAALGGLVGGTILLIEERRGRADLTLFLHPSSVALGGRF
jgi:hypothetical protein